jgi:hypothetical protein
LPQQNNGKTMALHAVATHFKYGIQRPPWQRHELSSVISLYFLDVYGFDTKQRNSFLIKFGAFTIKTRF